MINPINNSIRVCVFNAQISDKATDAFLQDALNDYSKINTEIIFVRNTGLSKSQFKKAEYLFKEMSVGDEPILIAFKADRFSVLTNEIYLLNAALDGGKVSGIGLKFMLLETQTKKIAAVALVNLSFNFYDLTNGIDNKLLKKIGIEEWLDLNKEAQDMQVEGVEITKNPNAGYGSDSFYVSSVTYNNLKNRIEEAEEKEKTKEVHVEKKRSRLSKVYHAIVDHKHHDLETSIKIKPHMAYESASFNTILCAVSVDQRQGVCHEFDSGQRFHTFEQRISNDNAIPSMNYQDSYFV